MDTSLVLTGSLDSPLHDVSRSLTSFRFRSEMTSNGQFKVFANYCLFSPYHHLLPLFTTVTLLRYICGPGNDPDPKDNLMFDCILHHHSHSRLDFPNSSFHQPDTIRLRLLWLEDLDQPEFFHNLRSSLDQGLHQHCNEYEFTLNKRTDRSSIYWYFTCSSRDRTQCRHSVL